MKIAKKVLAVVMAIAMIGCLTAMAFADATPGVRLVAGEVKNGKVAVSLYVTNSVGLNSFKYTITADPALTPVDANDAENPGTVKLTKGLLMKLDDTMLTMNISNGELGGLFQGGLKSTEDYKAIAEENEITLPDNFDANDAELVKINYTLADNATGAKISVAGEVVINGTTYQVSGSGIVGTLEENKETTTNAPVADTTTTEKTTVEKPTKEANPDTGDVNTGDTMAIAAAAGVVALAGAAFIISKKRK